MSLFLMALIAVGLLIVWAIGRHMTRRRQQAAAEEAKRQAEQQENEARVAELILVLDRADSGDAPALAFLVDKESKWNKVIGQLGPPWNSVYKRLISEEESRREYAEKIDGVRQALTEYKKASSNESLLEACVSLIGSLSSFYWDKTRADIEQALGVTREQLVEALGPIVQQSYAELYNIASDDSSAFSKLRKLIMDTAQDTYNPGRLKHFGVAQLPYPEDWHELAAKHVENPNLADFVFEPSSDDLPSGQIRLRAAEALRNNDLTEAKIVLAHCNAHKYQGGSLRRKEVGDYLAGKLAIFVAESSKTKESA